ncbi:hypothetical protein JHK85_019288 [Glycine max]|nr:hypothetical protein JHK85_019288 [Glycine max]
MPFVLRSECLSRGSRYESRPIGKNRRSSVSAARSSSSSAANIASSVGRGGDAGRGGDVFRAKGWRCKDLLSKQHQDDDDLLGWDALKETTLIWSLDGISDIRDESDRSGMRIVIELKRGSDPLIVLNNLYRLTSLQSTFSYNMVGILNGQPKQMGLKELLQAFLDFRCSVVERRARFKLSQAQERRHIVESGNFMAERKSLMEQISKLEELLSSRKNILEERDSLTSFDKTQAKQKQEQKTHLIEQEAIEMKNKFSNPRPSMLEDTDDGQLEDIDVIPNEEMILALSEKGYVKRMKPNTFNLQNRGTIGKSVGKLKVNDSIDKGTVYSARAYKIPECSRTAAGTPLVQVHGDELKWVRLCSNDDFVAMASHNGMVMLSQCKNGESDEQVVLISQSGTVNRIKVRDISIQSRFASLCQGTPTLLHILWMKDKLFLLDQEVILMRLDHSGKIQSASLISATDCEPEEVLTIAQG